MKQKWRSSFGDRELNSRTDVRLLFKLKKDSASRRKVSKAVITLRLIYSQERRCEAQVLKALNFEDMKIGQ